MTAIVIDTAHNFKSLPIFTKKEKHFRIKGQLKVTHMLCPHTLKRCLLLQLSAI